MSFVLGTLSAGSVSIAGVKVAEPPTMLTAPGSHEADDAWASLAPELDTSWERDWPRTIARLEGFLQRWPGSVLAQDKLYAALVADSQMQTNAGQRGAGVAELERAARLLPDRPEAWSVLTELATSTKT